MNTDVRMLPTDSLEVDLRYQRLVNSELVSKIASHYSEALFSPLLVAERKTREGISYYVVDGQHRLEAAKLLDLVEVPCFVYSGMTPAEEANLFVNQQVASRRLTPKDTYKANVFIGNPQNIDVIIDKTLKKYKHRIGVHCHDTGGWYAIVTLRDTVRLVGEDGLSKTLLILNELDWTTGRAAKSRLMLVAISHALKVGVSVSDIIALFSARWSKPEDLVAEVVIAAAGRKPTVAVIDVIDKVLKERT